MNKKSFRLLAAAALTVLASAAHADFVHSAQGVDFTFHGVDANTFTLRIENALDATGNWASATHLGYLGFKGLGDLAGLTGVNVAVSPAPGSSIGWTYVRGEMTSNGCNANANSDGICLDATPDLALTNNLLFTIDLLGSGIDITQVTAPLVKTSFTVWRAASGRPGTGGYKPAGYTTTGDLMAQTLTSDTVGGTLPEPASLGLAGLALAGLALTRRRQRG